ncbi:MAG: tannase/feruloyl esterase family alpha/beta hydrolase [Pseudomonadota bacterium]
MLNNPARWFAAIYLIANVFGTGLAPAFADPFADAASSPIDYRATPVASVLRCRDLIARSDYEFTVLGAWVISATDELPAHCRISGVVPSEVRFEVNLPLAWNGRLYMYGNGGLAGTPADDPGKQTARDQALAAGFATAYTDTGHDRRVEPGGTFAHNNFHKLVDYGFRAVHLTVLSAKTLAQHFYEQAPAYSYWNGCSTGGRQAMISAQRFPEDFDGIIAGAPAADYSGLKFSQAWRVAAIQNAGFEEAQVVELARHIYAQCDGQDGAEDGLIADPRRCDFSPTGDLPRCAADSSTVCFDDHHIDALEQYYAPVVLAGDVVYPAMPVGSEQIGSNMGGSRRTGWFPWLINDAGRRVLLDALGSDFFRYMVFTQDRPDFNWKAFDYSQRPDGLDEFRMIVDAIDPDLSQFKAAGGKLISYFGWADPDINPLTLINYRAEVAALDPDVDDYFRVFMIPGMFHCRGGVGPDRFDAMTPLINWTERGAAPQRLALWRATNSGARSDQSFSCPHPQEARVSKGKRRCIEPAR